MIIQGNRFNASRINTVVVAAVTSNIRLADAPGNIFLDLNESGLSKDSVVNVSQILTVDKSFFTERVGLLPPEIMTVVDDGLRLVLGLSQ